MCECVHMCVCVRAIEICLNDLRVLIEPVPMMNITAILILHIYRWQQ